MAKPWAVLLAAALLAACGASDAPSPAPPEPAAAGQAATEPQAAAPVADAPPAVPLLEQDLAYGEAQRSNLVGFLAMPRDAAEPLPGVILIHEWWGLDEDIKAAARRLAGEGYVALAVDLYGGKTAATTEEARALMAALVAEPDAARANLRQAYEYLDKYALAPRIGSIGWSLGGGWSLQTALMFPEQLDAMVMYYGQIVHSESELGTLKMPLLAHFGALDQSIPVPEVLDFRERLRSLGKNAQVLIYSGANQAFANPSKGTYDEKAATDSWRTTLEFLERSLKAGP